MDITKVNIEQLPSGNIELTSKIMFGIGEFLHTDTAQNLLDLLGISTTNVRPKLVDLNITVLENDLDTFLGSVNLTIAQGEIIFLRFFVIKNDSTLSRLTYTIPLGAGVYNPLGSTIVFEQLILVNEEFTGVSGNANTITYSFANLGEINASDPAIDFSDSEKEYIVILGTTPYLFIGDLGFYGVGELTMVIEDLQEIAVNIFNLQVNEEGETPIANVNRVEFANATVEDLGSGAVKVTPIGGGSTPSLAQVLAVGDREQNPALDGDTLIFLEAHKNLVTCELLNGNTTFIVPSLEDWSVAFPDSLISAPELKILNNSDFTITLEGDTGVVLLGDVLQIPENAIACIKGLNQTGQWSVTYQTNSVGGGGSTPSLAQVLAVGGYGGSNSPIVDATDGQGYAFSDSNPNDGGEFVSRMTGNQNFFTYESYIDEAFVGKINLGTPLTGASNLYCPETTDFETIATREWVEDNVSGGAVDSVNGQTGVVVLDAEDIGLGNVDNTSDADKPISTATQTALDLRRKTIHKRTEPTTVVTDTTSLTVMESVLIPADTFAVGDLIYIRPQFQKVNTNGASTSQLTLRTNTTDSTTGAGIIATYNALNGSNRSASFDRQIAVTSSGLEHIFSGTSLVTDLTTIGNREFTTFDPTMDNYFLFCVVPNNAGDEFYVTQNLIERI
jgi:hypothetical protein